MPVSVEHWCKLIRQLVTIDEGKRPSSQKHSEGNVDRLMAFTAVQALLRGGVFDIKSNSIGRLHEDTLEFLKTASMPHTVIPFLDAVRNANLRSIGVHIVDPIEGRISTIWAKPKQNGQQVDQQTLAKCELYSTAWNRIYRRLFRPSATLINAIESGVLPWQWTTARLQTSSETTGSTTEIRELPDNAAFCDTRRFFEETRDLATHLSRVINSYLRSDADPNNLSHIEEVFQKTWNHLEGEEFTARLRRVSTRFRDAIIDSTEGSPRGNSKEIFAEYLRLCSLGSDTFTAIESASSSSTEHWASLLDSIEAIQSSVLSQPEFCDCSGLWLHRIEFTNAPLTNHTSVYIICGLAVDSRLLGNTRLISRITKSLDNLGRALGLILRRTDGSTTGVSSLVELLCKRIKRNGSGVTYHEDGLKRWLSAIDRLAKGARHEGHSITYNVGYGSLAFAQAHLHRYEAVPDELSRDDIAFEKISSYVKGFYSIFGNHKSRGLWFDELGRYRGVFESQDGEFEKASSSHDARSRHHETILYAKIDGSGCFDVLYKDTNQIARVKNGEPTDMADGDLERRRAIDKLINGKKIPEIFQDVTRWLVNELVEVLQSTTHGTSFVVSFDGAKLNDSGWRSSIKMQVKTLVKHFSQLDAPLADLQQLKEYAQAWTLKNSGSPGDHSMSRVYRRPAHLFDSLAEYASLDGGLWLKLMMPEGNGERGGLMVRAAQQFIPLIRMGGAVQPLDLQMDADGLEQDDPRETLLPDTCLDEVKNLRSLFAAINGRITVNSKETRKYIEALSLLHHSGTKTHSLWGLSLTAAEPCLCVVLSADGNVYLFHDGREFTGLFRETPPD